MFSHVDGYPSRPFSHRRGGPVHVQVILRDLEVTLVETYLTAGEHGPVEVDPAAATKPSSTPYPQAA